jgi:hypothetical protein
MRFAWSEIAQPNLVNGAGLVASSFRAVTSWGMWIGENGLTGNDALYNANPDGDALDNLGEYALGGNPTNKDAASILPGFQLEESGGTNWLYYAHNERTDDPGLMYTVWVSTNLVSNVWKTNGVEFAGSSVVSNVWKTVTNRTEAVEDAKFISLRVEL